MTTRQERTRHNGHNWSETSILNITPIAGYSRGVTEQANPPESNGSEERRLIFEPPDKHVAADRVGKTLVNLAGSISKALGAEDEPVVLNRKGRHVSIKSLEDLIDRALEE
jgi:hypothetical protein